MEVVLQTLWLQQLLMVVGLLNARLARQKIYKLFVTLPPLRFGNPLKGVDLVNGYISFIENRS